MFLKFRVLSWLHVLTQGVFYHCVKASIFSFNTPCMLIYVQLHYQTQSRDECCFITAKNIIVSYQYPNCNNAFL